MRQGAEVFYKCRFQTAPALELADPLWRIVVLVRTWLCGRHATMCADDDVWRTRVRDGGQCSSDSGDVRIRSVMCENEEGGGFSWACRVEEIDEGDDDPVTGGRFAGRTWTTEIGYRESGDDRRGEMGILVSCYNEPRFIGRVKSPGIPIVPDLVYLITGAADLRCGVAGIPADRLVFEIGGTNPEHSASKFWSLVTAADRTYPIVYVGTDWTGWLALDPDELNRAIFPNALICNPADADAERRLMATQPAAVRCEWHGVSVFPPTGKPIVRENGFDGDAIESIRDNDREQGVSHTLWGEDTPDPVIVMIRRALAEDVSFYEGGGLITVEKLGRELAERASRRKVAETRMRLDAALADAKESRVTLNRLRREREERRSGGEADADGDDLVTSLTGEVTRLEREVDDALDLAGKAEDARLAVATELADARRELSDLSRQLGDYRRGDGPQAAAHTEALLTYDLPAMLSASTKRENAAVDATLVAFFARRYEDRIHVVAGALKGCITRPALLWQGMLCMCTAVYGIYARGNGSGNAEDRLKQDPSVPARFELAMSEGPNTNRNPRLVKLRQVSYEGRTVDITPHLKVGRGVDSMDTLRIYYGWDAVDNRLVIGHIGTHLLNDTSLNGRF